ncbi:bifunctional folylpolyglutamate synthase/dihydrofolate synthase [Sanguibacter suaedae]|uniref:Dihydrofolate synthase/folylpolyglutamate synthase n=1 Tax=Sanguibacter suaedae TaxID=2795737 RepID=A0A934IDB7_9MICO|nr:folylpolyglutamate synthase/dihydrofolate synthase family protein [Sanguibacter suaedae]MBI9116257.1 bifunctional folylpolyglutamate synthase/dihydrofolate synthase [Sanguibacter suaedae]
MSSRTNGRRRDQGPEVPPEVKAELDDVYRSIIARAPEHDIDPTLDRVRQVCELLGDPQKAFRTIHVTGTNGKTSTARMTERLVREHGLRTGRFTSPHLTSVTERIAIDGEPLSAERFIEVWKDVAPYVEMVDESSEAAGGPRLSFFEVLTVMAFAAFADAPVDVAVVEVGLGGLWDSTNVVDAEIAIITPVALDHQKWLGDTVEEIAAQKAGIVKDGATLVLAQQTPLVEDVVVEAASARGAHVLREGTDLEVAERFPAVGGQLMSLRTPAGLYTEIFMPVHGAHQAHNALLALAATEALVSGGGALDGDVVGAAFDAMDSPGRLEVVRRSPTILVDAAHNPAGAQALVGALEESFDFTRLVGVVGILADKDAETILSLLEPVLAEVVVTQSGSVRSHDVDDLEEIAREIFGEERVHNVARLDVALDVAAARAESEDLVGVGTGTGVLVTGSVVLAAEARILLGRG